jgi:hypothetical protein
MSDNTTPKRAYNKRSPRWWEKSGDRRTLLYNQSALQSPIGQKMLTAINALVDECNMLNLSEFNGKLKMPDVVDAKQLLAEIAEIERAK